MINQKPVAYRQHVEVTRSGVKYKEFTYNEFQIMKGDDALFTESQLKSELVMKDKLIKSLSNEVKSLELQLVKILDKP